MGIVSPGIEPELDHAPLLKTCDLASHCNSRPVKNYRNRKEDSLDTT
jgi:hypothetical protein